MIIRRVLEKKLVEAAKYFPVVALLGPRQSGKTTLARKVFSEHIYVNLEDLGVRALATADPKGFLQSYMGNSGVIFDEIQHVPDLFSYIQLLADEKQKNGYFVLTGSQNFALNERISQSLAGRVAKLTLFPLSIQELYEENLLPDTLEEFVLKGCYPKLYKEDVPIELLYKNYIHTYVEKDVRQIKNVTDLLVFKKFLTACAVRTGQLLNLSSIAEDLGISHSTVSSWLSLLASSYIAFLVQPYYEKYGKRLVKTPKLYFIDTGLACTLLGLTDVKQVSHSYLRGSLIETCIMADFIKQYYNLDKEPGLYFWRDQTGHEVDAIIDRKPQPIALEIKSSMTVSPDLFSSVLFWRKITHTDNSSNYVVYGGNDTQHWPEATVLSWKRSGDIIGRILRD